MYNPNLLVVIDFIRDLSFILKIVYIVEPIFMLQILVHNLEWSPINNVSIINTKIRYLQTTKSQS